MFGQSASFTGSWTHGGKFQAGIAAAFQEANAAGGVNNNTLRLVSLDDMYTATNVPPNMATLMTYPNLVSFIGFTGSPPTVTGLAVATAAKIPIIGPMTGTNVIRTTFNPYSINVRAGYDAEVMAMVKLLVEVKQLRRIALCYQNDSFGIPAYDAIVAAMSNLKLSPSGLYPHVGALASSYHYTLVASTVWASRPQAVILFSLEAFSDQFIKAMSATTSEKVIYVSGSWIGDGVRTFVRANGLDSSTYYQTQVVPHPLSTTSTIAAKYRAALAAYTSPSVPTYEYISMEGYVIGRFAIEALRRSASVTPQGLLNAIYETKMYQLDEILAGPFSNICVKDTSTEGRSSLCYCGQGLRFVTMSALNEQYDFYEAAPPLEYSITECFATKGVVSRPVLMMSVALKNTSAAAAAVGTVAGLRAAIGSTFQYRALEVAARNETIAQITSAGNQNLLVSVVGAAPLDGVCEYPVTWAFSQPALPAGSFRRNVTYALASLEQEVYALAWHLSAQRDRSLHVLYSAYYDDSGFNMAALVEKSVRKFDSALSSLCQYGGRSSLSDCLSQLNANSHLFVIGVASASEMSRIIAFLVQYPTVFLYLPFNDVALYWDLLNVSSSVAARVAFFTNLPNWMDPSTSELSASYLAAGSTLAQHVLRHPQTAIGYTIGRITSFVLQRSGGDMSPAAYLTALYRTSVVVIDDMTFGPFTDNSDGSLSANCNQGARTVNMFTVSDILSSAKPNATFRFSSCAIDYTVLHSGGTATSTILLAILVPLALLIAVVVVGYILRSQSRDNSTAPRDPTKPLAVVFTDIESSTMLWGRFPEHMAAAIDAHHSIMRAAIKKYGLYEVKTIGDSFMVVSNQPNACLEFALEVQQKLNDNNWQTRAFEDLYGAQAHKQASASTTPKEAPLEVDADIWNGLRVRMGINYGCAEIRLDETTKGYDYYGPVVNEAARIEAAAHGGQIVVSWDFLAAASSGPKGLYALTQLGVHKLRGVEHAIHLVQVLPIKLQYRAFAPLNLENDAGVESLGSSITTTTPTHSASASVASGSREKLAQDELLQELAGAHSLVATGQLSINSAKKDLLTLKASVAALFASSPAKFRLATVRQLGENWRLTHSHRAATDGAAYNALMYRLAARISENTELLELMHPATQTVVFLGEAELANSTVISERRNSGRRVSLKEKEVQ